MANKLRAKRLKLPVWGSIPGISLYPHTLLLRTHYIVSFPFSISIQLLESLQLWRDASPWMLIWIFHLFPFTSLIHFCPPPNLFSIPPPLSLSIHLSATFNFMAVHREILLLFILSIVLPFHTTSHAHDGNTTGVSYDSRSLIINGKRELLFSGSIHYTRSTPEVYIYMSNNPAPNSWFVYID